MSTLNRYSPEVRERAVRLVLDHENEHLVHHSDRGVQYLSIRYTERLAEAGIASSVGSVGDSYDNAMAETIGNIPPVEYEELYYRSQESPAEVVGLK